MITMPILQHIQDLDQQNQFQAIVDYILALPTPQRTANVLNELARAYNNLYWQDKCLENEIYLQKAVEILLSIETALSQHPEQYSTWHYHLGYAYYFLQQFELAEFHLKQVKDISHSQDLLRQLDWVKRHQISAVEASLQHSFYLLKDIFDDLQQYDVQLKSQFQPATTQAQLDSFMQHHQVQLPNGIQQLFLTFNGQTQVNRLNQYIPFHHFIALEEIPLIQQQWQNRLMHYFGTEWKNKPLSFEQIPQDWIKPQLFNPKWLPILINEHDYLCVDLDPIYAEDQGQIILVSIRPEFTDCRVEYYYASIQDFLYDFYLNIQFEVEQNLDFDMMLSEIKS